jgi:hypothetical protein
MAPDLSFFVALERRVWQALVEGDIDADKQLLDPRFLGVYASGFATRDEHAAQLNDGPVAATFVIGESRLLPLAPDVVLLSYRASFTRPIASGTQALQTMYVSSIWRLTGGNWLNIFSQDAPTNDSTMSS